MPHTTQNLAIIGTGISGMGCAHFLKKYFNITIYEKNNYAGGHTNTVTVDEDGTPIHIDTGFMVYNNVTYPLLTKLFEQLKIDSVKTSMSFSVQHVPSGLEYCGSGFNGLFAQRKKLFSYRHIKMLMDINRFNKESVKILDNPKYENYSLEHYITEEGYGEDMFWNYLVPMSSAVWSTPMDLMLKFPAVTLVRFFKNHGFLGLNTQHQWYTVANGSRMYRDKILEPLKNNLKLEDGAIKVERKEGKVHITSVKSGTTVFDKVIFACHADEALRLLADPTHEETFLLSKFKYHENTAILHTDESVMPKLKRAWSSWNYRIDEKKGTHDHHPAHLFPSTIYWMNSLQNVSKKKNYFVSINDPGNIHNDKFIKAIRYTHPLFDIEARNAQKDLPNLNNNDQVYFCGGYFRYGFHEDALLSAVNLCSHITGIAVL